MQIDRRAAIAAATALPAAALAVAPAVASPGFPSVYNVRDFGAAGDMIADDASAIQAAIDACGVAGGTVYFPAGRYLINSGLRIGNNPNTEIIELVGEGQPGVFSYYGIGSALIVTNNGVTGITVDFGQHRTVGPAFRRLHVIQKPGSPNGNGILIKETESCIFEDVTCSDYIGGYGLCFDGGPEGGNAQYAQLVNFSAGDCLYGLKTHNLGANGFACSAATSAAMARRPAQAASPSLSKAAAPTAYSASSFRAGRREPISTERAMSSTDPGSSTATRAFASARTRTAFPCSAERSATTFSGVAAPASASRLMPARRSAC
jgi:hypothetical protein